MTWLIFLLIGIAIGWLIEYLIDLFYWRSRQICPDPPSATVVQPCNDSIETVTRLIRMESERDRLLLEQSNLQVQLATLREQLHARDVSLAEQRAIVNQMNAMMVGRLMGGSAGSGAQSTVNVQVTDDDEKSSEPTDGNERVPCVDRPNAPCGGRKLERSPDSIAFQPAPLHRSALSATGREFLMIWGMDATTIQDLNRLGISDLGSLRNSSLSPELSELLERLQPYYPEADTETIHQSVVAQAQFIQNRNWERLSTETASYRATFKDYGDDLTAIWGINPEVAAFLRNSYRVRTFEDLIGLGRKGEAIAREILVETGWLKLTASELWSTWSTAAASNAQNHLASARRTQMDWLQKIAYDRRHSFMIIPGLSPAREERLRQQNIHSFDDLAGISFQSYRQALPWSDLSAYFSSSQNEQSVYDTIVSLASLLRDNDLQTFKRQQADFRQSFERDVLAIYVGLDENETPLNNIGIRKHDQLASYLNSPQNNGLDQEIEMIAQRYQAPPGLVRQAWLRQNGYFQNGDALGMAALLERMAASGFGAS